MASPSHDERSFFRLTSRPRVVLAGFHLQSTRTCVQLLCQRSCGEKQLCPAYKEWRLNSSPSGKDSIPELPTASTSFFRSQSLTSPSLRVNVQATKMSRFGSTGPKGRLSNCGQNYCGVDPQADRFGKSYGLWKTKACDGCRPTRYRQIEGKDTIYSMERTRILLRT